MAEAQATTPTSELEINYKVKCELDVSDYPHATPSWADMGVVFKNISQSLNEVLYQANYLADGGWGSTEVTGGQYTVTFTGDRKNGDPVNDYIFDPAVQFDWGTARKTNMKITRGTTQILWPVTLANITDAGGDANQPNAVTLTVHGNGKPTISTVTD